jgi:D-beta-D-heptose 7-phosphate kinase/D-beta-D-heptose 1-phosphate adenosyltransferase
MHHLLKLLWEKGSERHVVCVGDVMLDAFYYGDASRISPEAPIPVLRVERKTQTLGGAANVVNNLRSLSISASLVGIVGEDEEAKIIENLLEAQHVSSLDLIKDISHQTIIKNRYIAQDQQLLRVDFEKVGGYAKPLTDCVLERTKKLLEKAHVLVLSDYGKGVLTPDVIQEILKETRLQNKISIVDPKGQDYSIYRGATFLTPNKKELREATNLPTNTDEEVVEAAQKLIKDHGIENVLATRSEKGMTLVKSTGEIHHFRVVAKEVYDVSGAGDTVVATLAAGLSVGDTVEESVHLANLAGSVVVGKMGTATVSLAELEDAMVVEDRYDDQGSKKESKIVTLAQAMMKVKKWKENNLKVGFTNGCFDLLHLGHLKILQESKTQCDRLIVAVNTDDSVRRAKGPTRPVHNEFVRSTILSALSCVDLVILFGEDTPQKLIETLIPDVLVKGADYKISEVIGADIVQKNGGIVHLVELVDGQSTTKTVAKIQER